MRVGVAQDLMADDDASRPVMQAGVRKSMNVIGRYFEHAKIALRGQMQHTLLRRCPHGCLPDRGVDSRLSLGVSTILVVVQSEGA